MTSSSASSNSSMSDSSIAAMSDTSSFTNHDEEMLAFRLVSGSGRLGNWAGSDDATARTDERNISSIAHCAAILRSGNVLPYS